MISNNSTFQPQFTNERLKQEEIIEREKIPGILLMAMPAWKPTL